MLPVKPFAQSPDFCGPACLKMVLEFYGVKKSEAELVKLSGADRLHGATGEELVEAAKKLGFIAELRDNCELDDIRHYLEQGTPVIVDWFSHDDGHYSVVVDMDEENIFLQDPEVGSLKALDHVTFKRVWFDFEPDFLTNPSQIIIRRLIVIKPNV